MFVFFLFINVPQWLLFISNLHADPHTHTKGKTEWRVVSWREVAFREPCHRGDWWLCIRTNEMQQQADPFII